MVPPSPASSQSDELPDPVLAYLYSSLIFLLRRVDQRAVSLFNAAAQPLQLTLPQFHLLYVASEVGAFPQVELSRQVATNEGGASTIISNLIERGLLIRIADTSDGRRKLIEPTEAGQQMIATALPAFRMALAQLEAPLQGDREVLLDALETLIRNAGGRIAIPAELDAAAAQRLKVVHHSPHFLVRRIIQMIEASTSRDLVSRGLTLRQYVVLLVIALKPGVGESRIASTIGLDLSNTSFIARGLRTKKLVSVDETTRRRRYELTPAGRECIVQMEPALVATVASFLDYLPVAQRIPLLRLLGAVVLGGDGESAPPAFGRISRTASWPTAQRPAQFELMASGAPRSAADRLAGLLQGSAEALLLGPTALAKLTSSEQEQLEDFLRRIIGHESAKTISIE